jgi:hypothetical protein
MFDKDNDQEDGLSRQPSLNPAHVATIVCDEDPTQSLVEETRVEESALGSITEHRLGESILEGLGASVGLLSYLHEKGVPPELARSMHQESTHRECI